MASACNVSPSATPKQSILLFRDGNGIYLYEPVRQQERMIFKGEPKQNFLSETCESINDTLSFGCWRVEDSSSGDTLRYKSVYYSLTVSGGTAWESHKRQFEHIGDSISIIKDFEIEIDHTRKLIWDTVIRGYGKPNKRITEDNFTDLFIKSSTRKPSVYESYGDIYYINNGDTSLLVENKHPKTSAGNFYPQLDTIRGVVYYCYRTGAWNLNPFDRQGIKCISLKTHIAKQIAKGVYTHLSISNDFGFLLLTGNSEADANREYQAPIYIIDLQTGVQSLIGKASSAQWRIE